jgi:acetyl-CoA C-acetyltransferase
MNKKAFIVAAKRSAVIPKGGAFSHLKIHELAAPVIQDVLFSAAFKAEDISELVLSNAVGGGGNPARLAALAAGLPERVGGWSIDRQCTGGLDAIFLAAQMIKSGVHHAIVAGGSESASLRPIRMSVDPDGGEPIAYDRPDFTGLAGRDPEMIDSIANLARDAGITRSAQEKWAIASHAKAHDADFDAEMTIVEGQSKDSFARELNDRICARASVLSDTITSATTAIDADAAAFCLVVGEDIAKDFDCAVEIVDGASVGGAPDAPALAPLKAMDGVLAKTGLKPDAFQAVEIMEAYAAQAIIAASDQDFDHTKINIGGGALARGHPIGASGAILAVRLYHELQKSGGIGLATIAAAGGLGSALVLKA